MSMVARLLIIRQYERVSLSVGQLKLAKDRGLTHDHLWLRMRLGMNTLDYD